ncbi:M28 family metallopeptidase [Neolewinella lacunae]|uniref:M28 family peptidase n=1 Tax=Neolewinella lacunae TaxID=1517758 RepID=A0A923TCC7_9BACT|nr:M28 family metallopeptidase [Neolewinella lacunae]MBC6993582.1 M28 family peptidase [Neolewinella lacunae]MDN3633486.1 M28 family metallopeptidase [Neolewinella lacunae]
MREFLCLLSFVLAAALPAQAPPAADPRLYDIADAPSVDRLREDITRLANFGTRHTLSDTTSNTRGIGAARRWIYDEFQRISQSCGGCLEVFYQRNLVLAGETSRIPNPTWVVNVVAIQRGTQDPNRIIMMSGDIDSRISDPLNSTDDSPGANDNASGMAGVLEAARVLTKYQFPGSIAYVGLSGEEQGLYGGKGLAEYAKEKEWELLGVLNNDMIGNITGVDGITDNQSFRIFSEPYYPDDVTDERKNIYRRFFGGEVDGPSRQLARYVHRQTVQYTTNLAPMLVYRLDRFGRGGHHRPFNDAGFPGIRIMETHENYTQQHQDLRTEDGIEYGDKLEHVNFPYAAKLTGVNAITLAGLAAAPPPPPLVMIGGTVEPSARLRWEAPTTQTEIAGYYVHYRLTTEPQWTHKRFVPAGKLDYTFTNLVVDNYFFGVSSVSPDGNESYVVFPTTLIPRGTR